MKRNGDMVICNKCGKQFYLPKNRIERSRTHFCSAKCYNTFERPYRKQKVLNPYRTIFREGKHVGEHRYIMEKFLGRKLMRNEVIHHKNGNKQDNRIENLEIMNIREHTRLHKEKLPKTRICIECGKEFIPPIKHRGRNKLCSKECWAKHQKRVSPFKNKKVISYRDGNQIKVYDSIKIASKDVSGLSTNIVKCLKGKIKSAYGFKWEYSD